MVAAGTRLLQAMPASARRGAGTLAPAVVALAAFVFLAVDQGGFPATAWYPVGLYLVALLVVTVVAAGTARLTLSRPQAIATACLAGYTAWSFLSISWADVKGDAWDGANRTLLYLVVFTLFALLPWTTRTALIVLGLYVVATALVGVGVLIHVGTAADPSSAFVSTRLSSPTGYQNATAALFMTPAWAAVVLGTRREVSPLVRGVMLAAACVLVDAAVLAQSRGWLYATPIVAALFLAVVPRRVRSAAGLAAVGAAVWLAWPTLSDVYDAHGPQELHDASRAVWLPVGWTCTLLLVAGTAWGLADRRLPGSERLDRRLGQAAGAVAGLAVLAAVLLAATSWDASGRISRSWHEFTSETPSYRATSHFSSGLGGGRYDFWRVAVGEFRAHPVGGVGADNFALGYLRLRHVDEEPKYPHSVELRVLAGTGAVGAALVLGFLVAALAACVVRSRAHARRSVARATIAAAAVTFAYWWIHGSVDWFWEFPALSAPAFAFLAIAGRVDLPPPGEASSRRRPIARLVAVGSLAAVAVFAVVSFVPPWLAARDVAQASDSWRTDVAGALDRLRQARNLDFLSDQPDLVAGAIAARTGDEAVVRNRFLDALERNPRNWYPYLELGVLDALQGNQTAALRMLRTVQELNPREPTAALAIRRMQADRPITFAELDRIFIQRVKHRLS